MSGNDETSSEKKEYMEALFELDQMITQLDGPCSAAREFIEEDIRLNKKPGQTAENKLFAAKAFAIRRFIQQHTH